jgi:hypothetical protein
MQSFDLKNATIWKARILVEGRGEQVRVTGGKDDQNT